MKRILFIIFLLPVFCFSQQSKGYYERPVNVPIGTVNKKNTTLISNMPSYVWHRGCGPTALGMIIGYYDMHAFGELFDDNTLLQTNSIDMQIASDDHYNNYSLPLDYYPTLLQDMSELGTPHSHNSIADFMKTSSSICGNYWGWSWFSDIGSAFEDYVNYRNPNYNTNTSSIYFSSNSWNEYMEEIDNNRPVIILVDTDADGSTDHFVVGIGYDDSSQEFACYDTWDNNIHWYSWQEMANGINYGIFGFTKFNISGTFFSINQKKEPKSILYKLDLFGRKISIEKNTPLIYIYNDGTIEKKLIIE